MRALVRLSLSTPQQQLMILLDFYNDSILMMICYLHSFSHRSHFTRLSQLNCCNSRQPYYSLCTYSRYKSLNGNFQKKVIKCNSQWKMSSGAQRAGVVVRWLESDRDWMVLAASLSKLNEMTKEEPKLNWSHKTHTQRERNTTRWRKRKSKIKKDWPRWWFGFWCFIPTFYFQKIFLSLSLSPLF